MLESISETEHFPNTKDKDVDTQRYINFYGPCLSEKSKPTPAFTLPGQRGPTQSNLPRANFIPIDFPGSSVISFRGTGTGPNLITTQQKIKIQKAHALNSLDQKFHVTDQKECMDGV